MYSFAGGAAFVPEWGHAGVAYRFYDNDYGVPGGFEGGHEGGVDVLMRRHAIRGQAEVHRDDRTLSRIHTTAGYTNYRHFEVEASGAVGTTFHQDVASAEVIAHLDSSGRLGAGAVGANANYREITTGGSLRTPSTTTTPCPPLRSRSSYSIARHCKEAFASITRITPRANRRRYRRRRGSTGSAAHLQLRVRRDRGTV